MRLAGFELYRYELPLAESIALKGMSLHHREGVLFRVLGDGVEGWGEASPLPGFSRESVEEAARQLSELAALMWGREVSAEGILPGGGLAAELDELDPAPSVRFALELAICNLGAARRKEPLPELLAPRPAAAVAVNGLLPGTTENVLAEARQMRDAGYEAVKLKVGGGTVGEDLDLARAASEEIGGGIAFRLDANRAWSFEEASEFADGVAGIPLEYVEEPLSDPAGLPKLAADYGLPVALDESLVGMQPGELASHRYVRAVVLKPTLLGGISRTLRLTEEARNLGIVPVVSSAYETGVGTLALVALAAATGGAPAGLDTYRRLDADVLRPPLELPAPRLSVREIFAVRREVDRGRLERVG